MGVLKRKEEKTETITMRVPASVKAELDELRRAGRRSGLRPQRDASTEALGRHDQAGARRSSSDLTQ